MKQHRELTKTLIKNRFNAHDRRRPSSASDSLVILAALQCWTTALRTSGETLASIATSAGSCLVIWETTCVLDHWLSYPLNAHVQSYHVWFNRPNNIHIGHTSDEVPRAVKNHIAHSRSSLSHRNAVRSDPHPSRLFQKKSAQ